MNENNNFRQNAERDDNAIDQTISTDINNNNEDNTTLNESYTNIILLNMYRRFQYTDFVVKIDNDIINCHIFVLKSYSQFFSKLRDESINEIVLPSYQVTSRAFREIYQWMLEDNFIISRENFIEVFNGALWLSITRLLKQIQGFLKQYHILHEKQAYGLYLKAAQYNNIASKIIIKTMLLRIEKYFLFVVASYDFLEMPIHDVITLLKSDVIGPRSEIDIFMSCLRWLFHNYERRKIYITRIIECVRFDLILPKLLIYYKYRPMSFELRTIMSNTDVIRMVNRGIKYSRVKLSLKKYDYYNVRRLCVSIPGDRQWILDEKGIRFNNQSSSNEDPFENFILYLHYLQLEDPNYWEQFKFVPEADN